MTGLEDHIEYLMVMLFSGVIMPEERFDRLAAEHLRARGGLKLLPHIKEELLFRQHAYRLVLRGKPYLARLRHAGEIDNLKVMTVWDVTTVLAKLADLADEMPLPKPRERMW